MMKKNNIEIWKKKTEWLIENHGVILLITHPDYLTGTNIELYKEFLNYILSKEALWHILPKDIAVYFNTQT